MVKTLSVTMSALFLVTVGLSFVILFNFSSFMEGYYNGFVVSQTNMETVANFMGSIVWDVIKL
jgi:hypothetical protein